MYGEGAVTGRMCQKWFAKFRAADFSLEDAPQSDRPVEVDSKRIKMVIGNKQCSPMRDMADIFKISKSIK